MILVILLSDVVDFGRARATKFCTRRDVGFLMSDRTWMPMSEVNFSGISIFSKSFLIGLKVFILAGQLIGLFLTGIKVRLLLIISLILISSGHSSSNLKYCWFSISYSLASFSACISCSSIICSYWSMLTSNS